jgi:catechol 2,3-dioxygenase-like lactoylglutathione lyase family enzyme
MFDSSKAFSGFSVSDIEAARHFYGVVLGIDITEDHGMLHLRVGGGSVLVYPKPNHEPASYTMLNFPVQDIGAAVRQLAEQGVRPERYEGVDDEGIFRLGGPLIAWFKDPAGNIISVLEEA